MSQWHLQPNMFQIQLMIFRLSPDLLPWLPFRTESLSEWYHQGCKREA